MQRDALIELRRSLALTQEDLAERIGVATSTVARCERGETTPQGKGRARYAEALGVTPRRFAELLAVGASALDLGRADEAWTTVSAPGADDLDAVELIRRVAASDVGQGTLEALEGAVDRLCRSYGSTPPRDLLGTVAAHRSYIGRLLGGRATLKERRELIVLSGWLSLLAAVIDVDLDRRQAAAANLDAARMLATEAGHPLLLAWVHEVVGWQSLTDGAYTRAIDACRAGRPHATEGTSALVQLTVQEARAHARLGHARETHRLLDEAETSLGRMPAPDHPEHHFVFDPRKLVAYTATTLAWLGDDDSAAEEYGRRAVEQYDVPAGRDRWQRRLASARIDLALVLSRVGQPAEASHLGTLAVGSGRLVPSNIWRAAELDASLRGRYGGSGEVEAYHEAILELIRPVDRSGP